MQRKMILIADPDRSTVKALGNAFHEKDYDVRAARDGSRALEKSILVHPDLVLFDDQCPLIPPKKFIQILRSNPRTEQIPVIVLSGAAGDDVSLLGYREALIRKPFNIDEVLSLVATIFRRMATARQVREGGREIEGSLSQIGLVDLLQIFMLNRKTGLLELKADGQEGRLFVQEGGLVHASIGRHRGEKALFRMLQFHQGSFAFFPEKVTGDPNVRRSTEMLVLEGARQADELTRLRAELPPDDVRLLADPACRDRFEGLHPVTQEILNLLEFYNTVGELVEHTRVSDYEACRAIRTLLDKGVLRAVSEPELAPLPVEPLLPQDALYELKVRLAGRLRATARIFRAKILVLADDERYLREFVGGLRRLPGMELAGQLECLARGFGLLGSLGLSENLLLDWMLLPNGSELRPLWRPLMGATVGALVLHAAGGDTGRYRASLLAGELRALGVEPVLTLAAAELPARSGVLSVEAADAGQVREAVVGLLRRLLGREAAAAAAAAG